MKAVAIESFGHEDQLKWMDVPNPEPGPNEVLIEIAYTSVNPVDWKIRKGLLSERMPHRFPLIPGWDAAGTIIATGMKTTRFRPGDRVYAYCRKSEVHSGTYAEYIAVDEDAVALIPSVLNFREAAGIPLVGLTAWQCLVDAVQIRQGEMILIHAGSGGVGGMAIQFAKAFGAKVLTTASDKNHAYVKSLGADFLIDYRREDFVDRVRHEYPEGVDVVLDTVGGKVQTESYKVLKRGGRFVSIVHPLDPAEAKSFEVQPFYVFVEPDGEALSKISTLTEKGMVKPLRTEELPLKEVAQAHLRSEESHICGKLVLKVK